MHLMRIALVVALAGVGALACKRTTMDSESPLARTTTEGRRGVQVVGDFTSEDIAAITAIVKREDTLPLLSIIRKGKITEVMTGSICGPLCGSGRVFIMERIGSTWTIKRRGTWVS
jgi:hypothetical protein